MATKKSTSIKPSIVINCADADKSFVQDYFLKELKKGGLDVWFADTPAKEKDNGLAIVQSKIFLTVLSEHIVDSEKFKDELSLAYVANKSIFPISRQWIGKINPLLNAGVRLMLAKINWVFFVKEKYFQETMEKFIEAIKVELRERSERKANSSSNDSEETDINDVYEALNRHEPDMDINIEKDEEEGEDNVQPKHTNNHGNLDFWERHFSGKTDIPWEEFKSKFLDDYEEIIKRQLGGGKDTWLTIMLYKDIFELKKVVPKQMYTKFCGPNPNNNSELFFERLKDYAIGISCMRNIFNMDSSVRLVAIQNLGSFQTPAVITLLLDLIDDTDPNVRALASLALAKSGKKGSRIENRLIDMLNDEDRLVRESACLSLAHIKCKSAVGPILDRWRNDAIKHVREAAELALSRMGGAEAEQAIKVTQVLTGEMQSLRSNAKQ